MVYGWNGETTARSDYVRHNVAALERGRLEPMRTNKVRETEHLYIGDPWCSILHTGSCDNIVASSPGCLVCSLSVCNSERQGNVA